MITKIDARAYKSLKSFEIEPKNMNLLIGANGTGKTNFSDFIEFLSLTSRVGLKEAFDMQGGIDEVRTKLSAGGRLPALKCSIKLGPDLHRGIKEATYSFSLATSKSIIVDEEELVATVYPRSSGRPTQQEKVKFDTNKPVDIFFKRKRDKIEKWSHDQLGPNPEIIDDEQNLILNIYGKLNNFRTIAEYFGSMRVYNIDETLAKQSPNLNDSELERNGSNMIAFLKKIIENDKLRERLLNDLRYAVPYIKNISPERILTYTTLKFTEQDSKLEFRAQQMSDGTIRLLGLLAILRQVVPPSVLIIEEPENAIHSYAVKVFVEIAKEVSVSEKLPIQIFLTSHSPSVVDSVLSPESIIDVPTQGFVSKRRAGSSTIEKVSPKVIQAISKNLGRPSDFLREGDFDDIPVQLLLADENGKAI